MHSCRASFRMQKETAVAKRKLVQKKAAKRERTVGGSREGPARKKVKAVAQPKVFSLPMQRESPDPLCILGTPALFSTTLVMLS